MKSKLTILLLTLSIFANAQSKAAVFDMEAHLTDWKAVAQFDSIEQRSVDSLKVLGQGLIENLQAIYTHCQENKPCFQPPSDRAKEYNELKAYEAEINESETGQQMTYFVLICIIILYSIVQSCLFSCTRRHAYQTTLPRVLNSGSARCLLT